MNDALVQIKNISKIYKNQKIIVFKNLNYKFFPGKTYSIVGPSGSGKSSLLNILSLIDKPSSGKIIIKKKEVNFTNNIENDILRAKKIGIIYQDSSLLQDFTAVENIQLARLTINQDENSARKEAYQMLKNVGLQNRANHYPSELSGGEAQRVSICRALINSPDVILADEPTGSLDHINSREIFKILFKLKKKNRTIIFATHNMYFAKMADFKLQIINGKINSFNARIRNP